MKKILLLFSIVLLAVQLQAQDEEKIVHLNPILIEGELVKITEPLSEFVEPPFDGVVVRGPKLGYSPKDWPLNERVNPDALPQGWDPAWQERYPDPAMEGSRALLQNYEGLGYNGVNPPDPCMDVSSTHVIQMINGPGGAYFSIWDRATGNELQGQTYFDSFTGIGGLGDPIVLYDQMADRWMMSEFSAGGNLLVVAISQTASPLGSWYVYSYQANNFPDYPKYAIWNNAYVVTSNEATPTVYALNRTSMLAGTAGTAQIFTVPSYGTIGFQALSPIDFDGDIPAPAGTPAYVMRMADDAWNGASQDQLELWEFDIDFNNSNNTSLTQQFTLPTQPFDTGLCGYTSFSCIQQQGSGTLLDPLREVIMNRAHYRNFGTHESIVCCHVTDVNGNDRAGMRWYELRRTGGTAGAWSIYQEGTYSPDTESRWMGSVAINAEGSIALAFSRSSGSSFPALAYTGRSACDELGMMTEPETTIVTGGGANNANRYGDYASMSVDPTDGSFWFTGEYNPSTQWSTRMAQFDIASVCAPTVAFSGSAASVDEGSANVENGCLDYTVLDVELGLSVEASVAPTVTLSIAGDAVQGVDYDITPTTATLTAANLSQVFTIQIYNDAYVEGNETITLDYTLNTNGGNADAGTANQTFTVTVIDDDFAPANAPGVNSNLFTEDFSNGFGSFTTVNAAGGAANAAFSVGSAADASSAYFTFPVAPVSPGSFAWVSDDACNCDQADVKLITPVIDLTNASDAYLSFNFYFTADTYQGIMEEAQVEISVNGGPFVVEEILPGLQLSWQSLTLPLTAFVGNNIQVAFRYNDGGDWLFGFGVDDISIDLTTSPDVQTSVNSTVSDDQYLGPNGTVHYYDPASGNVMMTIVNTSNHDYGCTTVEVDRQGTTPTAAAYTTNNTSDFLHSKTFKVTPQFDNPAGTYDITLYYKENEVAAWESTTGNPRTATEIHKVAGDNHIYDVTPVTFSGFALESTPATLGAYNGDVTFSASFNSGFSGFGVGAQIPLPVELMYFKGIHVINTGNQLTWATATEINSDYFDVERSFDGQNFNAIGRVSAAGNSQSELQYEFMDVNYQSGTHYYRLKLVDLDGSYKYSDIVAISIDDGYSVNVFPNPFKDRVAIQFSNYYGQDVLIRVIDAAGRLVSENIHPGLQNEYILNTQKLMVGVYFIQVNVSGRTHEFKVVKN